MTTTRGQHVSTSGDCFSTCVYISILLLGILLSLVGISLITVAYVSFSTSNQSFIALGIIMMASALAVIIVAFYIRLRIVKDFDEERFYRNQNEDTTPPIQNYIPSASSVLSSFYALPNGNYTSTSYPAGEGSQLVNIPNTKIPQTSDTVTPHCFSSHSCLLEQRPRDTDFVYENPAALADDTFQTSDGTTPNTSITTISACVRNRDLYMPYLQHQTTLQDMVEMSQEPVSLPSESPTFVHMPYRLPEQPPAYSEHWRLSCRQNSTSSTNDEIPPTYEESLQLPL